MSDKKPKYPNDMKQIAKAVVDATSAETDSATRSPAKANYDKDSICSKTLK